MNGLRRLLAGAAIFGGALALSACSSGSVVEIGEGALAPEPTLTKTDARLEIELLRTLSRSHQEDALRRIQDQ